MKTTPLSLSWQGTFIELCMHCVNQAEKDRIEAALANGGKDLGPMWYDNAFLLNSLFETRNWWGVDDLDHSMGFVFSERSSLDKSLATMKYTLDGEQVTVDPDAPQLSFYLPETDQDQLTDADHILCHGILRQARISLEVNVEPPFDPTLLTLSFLTYPDFGHILIDMDYDGHDEVSFSWGETDYLTPRFLKKDFFDDLAD